MKTELLRERYEPLEVVGRGGEGEVIRALDHLHGRQVALKVRRVADEASRTQLLSEARLLLCMACVPQNGFYYDQLPLLLVPGSRREMLAAAVISVFVMFVPSFVPLNSGSSAEISARYIPLMVIGVYLPALVMVLRRPNAHPWVTSSRNDSGSVPC